MDGKQASKAVGMTYRRLNYYVKILDFLLSTPNESQGHEREFAFRDLVLLRLVNYLRSDGFKIDVIEPALKKVHENWQDDLPENAGVLMRGQDGTFEWSSTTKLQIVSNGQGQPIQVLKTIPKIYYNVKEMAYEIYQL